MERLIPSWISGFSRRLYRVIQYLPVIWKNEDWDYAWIYRLMAYKLRRVEMNLETDELHANAKRYARQARTCRLFLERLGRDEYCENEYQEYDQKWGKIKIIGHEMARPEIKTEEEIRESSIAIKKLFEKEKEMRDQDLEAFWRIFKKYHQCWWT